MVFKKQLKANKTLELLEPF